MITVLFTLPARCRAIEVDRSSLGQVFATHQVGKAALISPSRSTAGANEDVVLPRPIDIPGGNQVGGFGVSSFGLSTFQDTDGDGIPDARVPNISSGITAGILDGDDFSMPILIQALAEEIDALGVTPTRLAQILVQCSANSSVQHLVEQACTRLQDLWIERSSTNTYEAGLAAELKAAGLLAKHVPETFQFLRRRL